MSMTWFPDKASLTLPMLLSFFSCSVSSLASWLSSKKIEWERPSVLELLKCCLMLMFYFGFWIIRSISVYLPLSVSASGFFQDLCQSSASISKRQQENAYGFRPDSSHNAIARSLIQVLALVNDIPVTSEKYEFARTLAEKVIQQNISHMNATLMEANRYALATGFIRTLKLLTASLETLQQQDELGACIWPWKSLRHLFQQGISTFSQMLPLESVCVPFIHMLFPRAHPESLPFKLSRPNVATGTQVGTDSVVTEKFVQELLWISQKLKECSAIDEAIMQWSLATSLANLSLTAYPRIQSALLKICGPHMLPVFLLKEFLSEDVKQNQEQKCRFLLLWVPLFCRANNGYNTLILSHTEKAEVVSTLEAIILSLPGSDQEIVLATWLQEYSLSSSDWPNLQQCYERWYRGSFKSAFQSDWS